MKRIDFTAKVSKDDCTLDDGEMAKIIEIGLNPFVRIIHWSQKRKHPEWMKPGVKLRVTIEEVE